MRARFVGVEHRRSAQMIGELTSSRLQASSRAPPVPATWPSRRQTVHVGDQLGSTRMLQRLTMGQMYRQRAHTLRPYCTGWVTPVGKRLTWAWPQSQVAAYFPCAMRSNAPASISVLSCRSFTTVCISGSVVRQRVHWRGSGWLIVSVDSAFRLSMLPLCPHWGLVYAGGLAQRIGFTQTMGRRRRAGVAAVLGGRRFQCHSRYHSINDALKVGARKLGEVGGGAFFAITSMIIRREKSSTVL